MPFTRLKHWAHFYFLFHFFLCLRNPNETSLSYIIERSKWKTESAGFKNQNMVCVYATKFCIQVIMHHELQTHQEELMKKLCGFLLAGILLAAPANAQMSVSVTLDSYTGYIWRGYVIGADDRIVAQPGIEVGFGETGLTVGGWGSWFVQDRINDRNPDAQTQNVDELDFYADYSRSLSEDMGLGISIGYIQYVFPSASEDSNLSQEAYIGISLDNAISPAVTFYYDFGLVEAWYVSLSTGYDIPLGSEDGQVLSIGASVAMSNYEDKTGFNDVTVTASLSCNACSIAIAPTIGFSYADTKINPDNRTIWGGVSIGFSR